MEEIGRTRQDLDLLRETLRRRAVVLRSRRVSSVSVLIPAETGVEADLRSQVGMAWKREVGGEDLVALRIEALHRLPLSLAQLLDPDNSPNRGSAPRADLRARRAVGDERKAPRAIGRLSGAIVEEEAGSHLPLWRPGRVIWLVPDLVVHGSARALLPEQV